MQWRNVGDRRKCFLAGGSIGPVWGLSFSIRHEHWLRTPVGAAYTEYRLGAVMEQTAIAAADVASLLADGHAQNLIDVRTPAEFTEVHADGAKLLPLDMLNRDSALAARTAPDRPLYLICKS